MATSTAKKPRTSLDAVPQLATLPERVAVLEVNVVNINEKMDDIKADMCANHDSIISTLKEMRDTSVAQHTDMANKIKELEGVKNKWYKYGMIALAFAAGAGWLQATSIPQVIKFLGL